MRLTGVAVVGEVVDVADFAVVAEMPDRTDDIVHVHCAQLVLTSPQHLTPAPPRRATVFTR